MVVLRSAWYGGDGAVMVAAVEAVGLDVCLQWAGDLVRAALQLGATGAAQLAERTAIALRQRGWEGDDELADAIDDARHQRAGGLTELPVDLEELAMLLDAGGPSASGGRIDLHTGEVWPKTALEEAWPGSEDELDDEDRWLGVWPRGSGAAYDDMVDFAAARAGSLREHLDVAVRGRGAFRRFKDVLFDLPDDRAEWFAFAEDRSRGRARAWLADARYRPTFHRSVQG
jgi:hypothetical protein